MEIINMTPHPVMICDGEGRVLREYPASGAQIRLRSETVREGSLPDGTPLSKTIFGEATGLPRRKCWDILHCVPACKIRPAKQGGPARSRRGPSGPEREYCWLPEFR